MDKTHGPADDIYLRLKEAERIAAQAREELRNAEALVRTLKAAYATARPLTESERDTMAAYVAAGGALCCTDGLVWLKERLPEPWAQAINGWAYEYLGCSPRQEWLLGYAERVRRLALDRLPSEDC